MGDGSLDKNFLRDAREKELLEKETKLLGAIVNSSKDAIVSFSMQYEITGWNKAATDLLGVSVAEVIGKRLDEVLGQSLQLFESDLMEHTTTFEQSFLRNDGVLVDLSVTLYGVADFEGVMQYGIAIIQDVTARKRAERDLLRLSQQLLEANTQLEEYAWMTAHDLKEPVRVVATYAALIRADLSDVLGEDGTMMLNVISEAAQTALTRIDATLKFASLGKNVVKKEWTTMEEILNPVLQGLQILIEETDATVELEKSTRVFAEKQLLKLVLQNLISNALKFRSDEPPLIKVTSESNGDCVVISVSDNGIGLNDVEPKMVFGMFKQLDPKIQGTGLGLTIAKRAVELQGGTISFEPNHKQGTVFKLSLPKPSSGD